MSHASGWAAGMAVLSLSLGAWAQPDASENVKRAEELYKEGRDALERGDATGACAKFAESWAANERVTTLVQLASCREDRGAFLDARARYRAALERADELEAGRRESLRHLVEERLRGLDARMPTVRLTLPEPFPGMEISLDGAGAVAAGMAIGVDPGRHVVVATAPGCERFERAIEAREGETVEVEVRLVRVAATPPPSSTVPPTGSPTRPSPMTSDVQPPAEATGSDAGVAAVPVWAWLTAGAGLALGGVAIGFEVDSRDAVATIEERCGASRVCTQPELYEPSDDNARKNRGYALFVGLGVAGVTALGAGIAGIVFGATEARSAPDAAEPTAGGVTASIAPLVRDDGAGLALAGRF